MPVCMTQSMTISWAIDTLVKALDVLILIVQQSLKSFPTCALHCWYLRIDQLFWTASPAISFGVEVYPACG